MILRFKVMVWMRPMWI